MNCDLRSHSFESSYFRDMVYSLAQIVPSGWTHHTATSGTWHYPVFVHDFTKVTSYIKSEAPFIADHDLLVLSYDFLVPPLLNRAVKRRNYRDLDKALFNHSVRTGVNALYESLSMSSFRSLNIESVVFSIKKSILGALDQVATLHICQITKQRAPWLIGELKATSTTTI